MTKVAIALFILCAALGAHAHSGGTDSQGCHVDHKTGTKHCH
ncbi:YHYH domain-containing protein [Acidovorax sp. Root402]